MYIAPRDPRSPSTAGKSTCAALANPAIRELREYSQTSTLPSSVHTSKFRIPQLLYLPLLRKHAGCGGILPILVRSARSLRWELAFLPRTADRRSRSGRNWRPQTDDCQLSKRGEMGTGARGAPVPEVGLYVKIKRAQLRGPDSRPNDARGNSPCARPPPPTPALSPH